MLATQGEVWKQEWLAEGKASGRTEGRTEGRIEGKIDSLIRLLIKRFGPLEPDRQGLIRSSNLATVETWFDRAIDARDLTSVFEPR